MSEKDLTAEYIRYLAQEVYMQAISGSPNSLRYIEEFLTAELYYIIDEPR